MKWLLILLLAFAHQGFAKDNAGSNKNPNQRLVTARLDSVKLLELDPRQDLALGEHKFQVVLSDIQVIHGNSSGLKGRVETIFYGNDLIGLEKGKRVALLVDYTTNRDFKVLSLQPIRQLACFSPQDIDVNFEKYYWNEKWGGQGKCIFLIRHVYEGKDEIP